MLPAKEARHGEPSPKAKAQELSINTQIKTKQNKHLPVGATLRVTKGKLSNPKQKDKHHNKITTAKNSKKKIKSP